MEEEHKLEILVRFCVLFYFKLYFEITVKNKVTDGPYHVLNCLKLLRCQESEVRDIITPYIQSEAWFSHSENVLTSLLSSKDPEDRSFALGKIAELRGDNAFGDRSVRPRRIPKLNFSAEKLQDLIEWKKGEVYEPIFTSKMSSDDLQVLYGQPLNVPPFKNHTQATERCVKLVTEASASVCGQEARDKYIKSRVTHREQLKKFRNKQDFMSTF